MLKQNWFQHARVCLLYLYRPVHLKLLKLLQLKLLAQTQNYKARVLKTLRTYVGSCMLTVQSEIILAWD